MFEFDLVIRGGTAGTAVDVYRTDIGVRDGRIAARKLLVLAGGIDAHRHLDQPTGDESVMADDFASGTRSGRLRRRRDGDAVRRPDEGPITIAGRTARPMKVCRP